MTNLLQKYSAVLLKKSNWEANQESKIMDFMQNNLLGTVPQMEKYTQHFAKLCKNVFYEIAKKS